MTALTRENIVAHIARWSAHSSLSDRGWVPRFAYHFTDVQNAANILRHGGILSRSAAIAKGLMVSDNASESVIGSTRPEASRCVRLYFRPRTPTQYRNEGIRAPLNRELGAHCPVPVFFVFDLVEILSQPGTRFSDGSLAASRAQIGDSKEFFDSIPFGHVFHDRSFTPAERDEIVFRRQAEVLANDELGLDHLRYIICRSDAERRTLLQLAGEAAPRWKDLILTADRNMFFHRGCFVQSAESQFDHLVLVFRLSGHAMLSGAEVEIQLYELSGGRRWESRVEVREPRFTLQLGGLPTRSLVTVRVFDELAFCGELDFTDDLPF